jgi:hypothetical protein
MHVPRNRCVFTIHVRCMHHITVVYNKYIDHNIRTCCFLVWNGLRCCSSRIQSCVCVSACVKVCVCAGWCTCAFVHVHFLSTHVRMPWRINITCSGRLCYTVPFKIHTSLTVQYIGSQRQKCQTLARSTVNYIHISPRSMHAHCEYSCRSGNIYLLDDSNAHLLDSVFICIKPSEWPPPS